MNAIEAARNINYKDSVVFDDELSVSCDARKALAFNAKAAVDPAFVEKLTTHLDAILAKNGLGEFAGVNLSRDDIKAPLLTQDQMAIVGKIQRMAKEHGQTAYAFAADGSMAEEPMGHVAAALVVVAVAALVWTWVGLDEQAAYDQVAAAPDGVIDGLDSELDSPAIAE